MRAEVAVEHIDEQLRLSNHTAIIIFIMNNHFHDTFITCAAFQALTHQVSIVQDSACPLTRMSCGVPTAATVWRKRIGSDDPRRSRLHFWHPFQYPFQSPFLMALQGFLSEAFAIRCRDLLKITFNTYLKLPCLEKTVYHINFNKHFKGVPPLTPEMQMQK